MRGFPLILADANRAEQFLLLGRSRHLFDGFSVHTDGEGVVWATRIVAGHTFAVTWLGPGWVFDAVAQERWTDDLNTRRQAMRDATPDRHCQELEAVVGQMRLGMTAERMLWLIHQQVLRQRTSLLRLPDVLLADAIWGTGTRPTHWRQDILKVLESLTWLHLSSELIDESPALGADTAVLTHVADLRGAAGDVCGDGCEGQGARVHHHYLINVARGFLGILEQFVHDEDDAGVRTYALPVQGRSRRQSSSLRRVGKSGQLVTIYLPAKLGVRAVCETFTVGQHRLLQAIVRETTRNTKEERESVSEAEVMHGNVIPTINGQSSFACGSLEADREYVGFNGNKILKGRGYLVASPRGWMAKAGYALEQVRAFLDDLTALADKLAIIPIGIDQGNHCLTLSEVRALMASSRGVRHLHLRVYARSDYLARWNQIFGWQDVLETYQAGNEATLAVELAVNQGEVSQTQLADGMGVDRSLLSKVIRGKKPWPQGWLHRATSWLNAQRGREMEANSTALG